VPVGASVVVSSIDGPTRRALRWAELGLRPGARIVVRSRTSSGGRILGVGLSRMAVDGTVLRAVQVVPPEAGDTPRG
jgi:hypothetical protein